MTKIYVTVDEIKKHFYVHRHKVIRFNGLLTPAIPQREGDFPDEYDSIFSDQSSYQKYNRKTTAALAELDEAMNYCQYFIRDKGNNGHYVRDGKSFPVDGSWIGIQDFDSHPPCQPFVAWLNENGWRDNWFELMERYKDY